MNEAITIAVISGFVSLGVAIIPKIIDNHFGNGKKIEAMANDISSLNKDMRMVTDVLYNILDHLSTNNNTGGMGRCLKDYNEYFRGK